MGNGYRKVTRGNLTFYISPKKIYCKTNLQLFYITNRNPFSNTEWHISLIGHNIEKGYINSIETLAEYCDEHLQWVHTDRTMDA